MSDCLLPEKGQTAQTAKAATGAMFTRARLATRFDHQRRRSCVQTLRSDGPLVLRNSNPKGPEPLTARRNDVARVALAAGTAGPIGGDVYTLDVTVGAGSTLFLQEVSAMLILPGCDGHQSRMSVSVTVEEGATFVWWSEPIIAALRCNHRHDVRIELADTARLVMREELLLGRHGEAPGDMRSRLRITRSGKPVYDQETRFGPSATSWNGAAILGNNRATGSIIVVDPEWEQVPPDTAAFHHDAVLAPLSGPAVAISAVAADSHDLRALLNTGLNTLGSPWSLEKKENTP